MAIPDEERQADWSSVGATPSCIGGVRLAANEFFVGRHEPFLKPFLPLRRQEAHIDEIEFSVEIACTVLRSASDNSLISCWVAKNACSNM